MFGHQNLVDPMELGAATFGVHVQEHNIKILWLLF
jgi:hypothetical protein